MSETHTIRVTERTERELEVSDEEARRFVRTWLEDHYLLREVWLEDGRRMWTEIVGAGSHSWQENHDMGAAREIDVHALAVIHDLR